MFSGSWISILKRGSCFLFLLLFISRYVSLFILRCVSRFLSMLSWRVLYLTTCSRNVFAGARPLIADEQEADAADDLACPILIVLIVLIGPRPPIGVGVGGRQGPRACRLHPLLPSMWLEALVLEVSVSKQFDRYRSTSSGLQANISDVWGGILGLIGGIGLLPFCG